MDASQPQAASQVGAFPQTDWFQVGLAGDPLTVGGQSALDGLLRRYQPLVLTYLCHRHRISPEEARDAWQSFVLSRVLEHQCLKSAHPSRGRFRSFLLRCLDNHVRGRFRQSGARKRSPGTEFLPLDQLPERELATDPSAAELDSEVVWERAVIAGALLNMQRDCLASGHRLVWEVFTARLLDPILDDSPPLPYDALVARCGFESPARAANALTTAKRMFRRHLRSVIAEYAGDDASVAEELNSLGKLLDSAA